MPVFLEDLIRPFYQPIGQTFRATLTRGQICFAPISYARENLELWRPHDYDDSKTSATNFQIVAAPADKFARSTPLATPPLATNEEFVVSRVKMRPVIVLGPAPPDPGIQGIITPDPTRFTEETLEVIERWRPGNKYGINVLDAYTRFLHERDRIDGQKAVPTALEITAEAMNTSARSLRARFSAAGLDLHHPKGEFWKLPD